MSNVVTYPHTEEPEMSKVKEIFDRALNALVSASSLAKEVEQVKSDLEALTSQVNHYRNTIANQDDQITRLRQDRDAARTAQYHAEDAARHQANALESAKRDLDSETALNVRLNDRISEVIKERDEAQFKLLELQESHEALSKKMDAIKSLFGSLSEPVKEPEPSTVAISPPSVALSSSTGAEYKPLVDEHSWSDPSLPTEPEPPVNPPEPSYPEDIKR